MDFEFQLGYLRSQFTEKKFNLRRQSLAKRESYETNIGCASCGAKGKGRFTENENPVYTRGKLDRVVDDLDEGFSKNDSADEGMSCNSCESLEVRQV